MNCSQLAEEYELYALGAAEPQIEGELRTHLSRHCDACSRAVQSAVARVSFFAGFAPLVDPPKRLRTRVLASIGVESRSGWSWMRASAAAALCVLLGVFWFGHTRRERVRDLALRDAMELLNAPETLVTVSAAGAAQASRAKVFLNPDRGVVLLASNLPPAPADKIYEMWVVPAGGNPIPAGLFQTGPGGTAVHVRKGPVDIHSLGAIAVTLEAAGGALQPTSEPVLVAKLKG